MKILLALILALTLTACTDPDQVHSILSSQGYTEITVTGYEYFGCGQGDFYHTGFTAKSPNGTQVSGVVCSGILKGATVRF